MIWNLGIGWMFMAVSTVAILAFIFSLALDAIIGSDGFGPFGTMGIVVIGFFGGIYLLNLYGIRLAKVQEAAFGGLIGAFVVLIAMLLAKAVVKRI